MTEIFGETPAGDTVLRYHIRNGGVTASVLTWGATLQDFRLEGIGHSLTLGANDMAAYLGPMRYFGAIVGPVANRIAGGQMQVGGTHYTLDRNEAGRTTLHGGLAGFSEFNWKLTDVSDTSCTLSITHPDGLGGFPGTIQVSATYSLDAAGVLSVDITGQTDATTYFSPAFHGYWNLSGHDDLSDHRLCVFADEYLPVDADQIPVGAPQPVAGTGFDYRAPQPVGDLLDHNFCLPAFDGGLRNACQLEAAGLTLTVATDQPGLQVYNGAHIRTAPAVGQGGRAYGRCAGLAIEPQFWPDTPNQRAYPSSLLVPGRTSQHRSRFHVVQAGAGAAPNF